LYIRPTLTAHPTEARRRAVMDKLQEISSTLASLSMGGATSVVTMEISLDGLKNDMIEDLVLLWNTDEIRDYELSVADEVRNVLYFFDRTIIGILPRLQEDLRNAVHKYYPDIVMPDVASLQFGSWVGGDRDGNPKVTSQVTYSTAMLHKRTILNKYLQTMDLLKKRLTISSREINISPKFQASLEEGRAMILVPPEKENRFASEPFSLKVRQMKQRLLATIACLSEHTQIELYQAYKYPAELIADIDLIRNELNGSGLSVVANSHELIDFEVQVRAFGFHLAPLDIRQHSAEHEKEIERIIRYSSIPQAKPYTQLDEQAKIDWLTRELLNPRPMLNRLEGFPESDFTVLEVLDIVRKIRRDVSENAIGPYIISMTHGLSDLLEPLFLAKEAGLVRLRTSEDGQIALESDIDVVPLFETIEDLNRAEELMEAAFTNEAYRLQISARNRFQEIMLGYSDSSKDGGFLAANWALQQTQAALARACHKSNIKMRLFHGRGGTVGRGGGRANRAILSQPPGSFDGAIRFTEQGEVISFRYGLAPIAHRHLEQIVSASILAAARNPDSHFENSEWHDAMITLAELSRVAYRGLVYDDPEFWQFYSQATPIAHISRLPIASRPVFRPGGTITGIDQLRAIPWVFAWVQSRYVLPGWYGIGSAIDQFVKSKDGALEQLQSMYTDWPFFKTILDAAQLELLRTYLPIAKLYSERVVPPELGERIHNQIAAEHARTMHWVLQIVKQDELLSHAPVVRKTVDLRNPSLEPLSRLQVELLKRWDAMPPEEREADKNLREAILLTITGIAAAMQSTG
ncbi:MAG: phosphoenolpyruvate carboxylase, partial [Chthonomonadales bacterium]